MHNGLKKLLQIEGSRAVCFVQCFSCIGSSARCADRLIFGLKPIRAFTIGVSVNVPFGYFLSTVVFSKFWSNISSLM